MIKKQSKSGLKVGQVVKSVFAKRSLESFDRLFIIMIHFNQYYMYIIIFNENLVHFLFFLCVTYFAPVNPYIQSWNPLYKLHSLSYLYISS